MSPSAEFIATLRRERERLTEELAQLESRRDLVRQAIESLARLLHLYEPATASAPRSSPLSAPTCQSEPGSSEAGAAVAGSPVESETGEMGATDTFGAVLDDMEDAAPPPESPARSSHKAIPEEIWEQRERQVMAIMNGETKSFTELKRRVTFPLGSLYTVLERLRAAGKVANLGYGQWGPVGAAPKKPKAASRAGENPPPSPRKSAGKTEKAPPAAPLAEPDPDGLNVAQRALLKVITAAYEEGESLMWGAMAERAQIRLGSLSHFLHELEKRKLIVRDAQGLRPFGAPPKEQGPAPEPEPEPVPPPKPKSDEEMIAEHLRLKGVTLPSDEWPTAEQIVAEVAASGAKVTHNDQFSLFTVDGKKIWRDALLAMANRHRLWQGRLPWSSARVRWPNEAGVTPPVPKLEGVA